MKTFTKEELADVIEKHKKWLDDEQGGERADLSGADLSYADLRFAGLSDANLSYADLRGADLSDANLSYADLSYADLSYADTQSIKGITILSVDNIGTYNGKATFLPSQNKVWAGCWEGTLDEFLKKGKEKNKNDAKQLRNIELAYELFKNNIENQSILLNEEETK